MMIWRGLGTGQLTRLMQDARDLGQTTDAMARSLPQPQPKAPPSERKPSSSPIGSTTAPEAEPAGPLHAVRDAVPKPLAPALATSAYPIRPS